MLILNIQVLSSLVLFIQNYEPEKICLILENRRGKVPKSHTILTKITPSDSAYQRTLLQEFQAPICKNVEFRIFLPEDQPEDHGCVFICSCLFFFPGVIVSTDCSQNVARGLILTENKSSSTLFKLPKKLEGSLAPSQNTFLPKVNRSKL